MRCCVSNAVCRPPNRRKNVVNFFDLPCHAESGPIFDLYQGKNTPERKDYIWENLVVPVED